MTDSASGLTPEQIELFRRELLDAADFTPVTRGNINALCDLALHAVRKDKKWCSYCQKDNHNDAECWSTRPANWESGLIDPLGFPLAAKEQQ